MKNIIKTGSKEIKVKNEIYTLYWKITFNSNMGHPCAYICLPEDHISWGNFKKLQKNFYHIDVHGGVTYNENLNFDTVTKINDESCVIFGWDYGHIDDYSLLNPEGTQYSVEEIQTECESAIDQIAVILNN